MTRPQATSGKLQATSGKILQATSGPEARPPAGVGIRPHPKRGWEIRALHQPQPPAKYIRFSRISQELFCRRTLNIFLDNILIMGYDGINGEVQQRSRFVGPSHITNRRHAHLVRSSTRAARSTLESKPIKDLMKAVASPGDRDQEPQASSAKLREPRTTSLKPQA